jgi:adenylate kinase
MSHTRYQTVLLFGAPGAGKGTQGKILGQVPGFYHLSCGEVFRTIDTGSELGRTFLQYSSKGLLVPDDVTVRMWQHNMHARTVLSDYKPRADVLVLDGIRGRAPCQAPESTSTCPDHPSSARTEQMIAAAGALKRTGDAKEEVIRKRWEVYEKETFPVLKYPTPHP